MNIIIVGCGKVGQKIAEKLSQENEHNITVIDSRRFKIENITGEYDVMGVVGSCADIDVIYGIPFIAYCKSDFHCISIVVYAGI